MSDNVRGKVEARLRKWHDDDLREATAAIDSGTLSELVRDGLRVMLGIRTKKQLEIKERPLMIPQPTTSQTVRQTSADTGRSMVPGRGATLNSKVGGVWGAQKS